MKNRAGYSLIEMVLVIGALSAVLGLCVGTIRGLVTLDRSGRARLTEEATLSRLARQVREDVRAARSGIVTGANDKNSQLDLRLSAGQVIEYRWAVGRLTRTRRGPGKTESHEAFTLPHRANPRFKVSDEAGQTWVTFVLEPKADVAPLERQREFLVEAWLGKDHRLDSPRSKP
jgi:type II secretory pathway component PulJ